MAARRSPGQRRSSSARPGSTANPMSVSPSPVMNTTSRPPARARARRRPPRCTGDRRRPPSASAPRSAAGRPALSRRPTTQVSIAGWRCDAQPGRQVQDARRTLRDQQRCVPRASSRTLPHLLPCGRSERHSTPQALTAIAECGHGPSLATVSVAPGVSDSRRALSDRRCTRRRPGSKLRRDLEARRPEIRPCHHRRWPGQR